MRNKNVGHKLARIIYHYVLFFLLVAFLVSCSMVLFITVLTDTLNLNLTSENVSMAAKLTFGNVLFLSVLFTVIDAIRRKLTTDKAAEYIAQEIEYETGFETRETVLGYIQRGGAPTAFDRNLATRMGGYATEMIATGQFGRMVALQGKKISSIPLEEVAGKLKLVNEDHDLIVQGKRMGVCFG